ncbi:MAG: hypothetical protein IBX68_02485 [Dehalococcoidia bacterium]|nr:hypothetical protein [Dehalococcoidia bacterium]
MNKMLTSAVVILLAAAMLVTGLGLAVAQDQMEADEQVLNLVVTAPHIVAVDEPANISVTDPDTGEGVEGANLSATPVPVCAFLFPTADYSLPLGQANATGEIEYAFQQAGTYMLIATADNYGPGIAGIIVSPAIAGKLQIQAPARAEANQTIAINVVDRETLDPVSEADVWAVPGRGANMTSPDSRAGMDRFRERYQYRAWSDLAEIANEFGLYLGQTDAEGAVQFEGTIAGRYLLVALKDDYVPGIRVIRILPEGTLDSQQGATGQSA